jgi:hypothetical protein
MPENGVITNAKDFEKLVRAWKVADKVPEVNFDKELVLVTWTQGSRLRLSATLDEKGNLKARDIAPLDLDLRPGFSYVIISVPKEGVKTVNGKELPASQPSYDGRGGGLVSRFQYAAQVMEQLVFVSSILAGFAFAIIVQLVTSSKKTRIIYWSLTVFLVCASALLFATFAGAMLRFAIPLSEVRGGEETYGALTPVLVLTWLSFGVGLLTFSLGISLVGWTYSVPVGVVGLLCAVLLFLALVLATFYMGSVFMHFKQTHPDTSRLTSPLPRVLG